MCRATGVAYFRRVPADSTSSQPTVGKRGSCCCLLPAVLPVVWLLAAALLPGKAGEVVGWGPLWLVALLWNGEDGQSGISHFLG